MVPAMGSDGGGELPGRICRTQKSEAEDGIEVKIPNAVDLREKYPTKHLPAAQLRSGSSLPVNSPPAAEGIMDVLARATATWKFEPGEICRQQIEPGSDDPQIHLKWR
jgi:hypothetical protein